MTNETQHDLVALLRCPRCGSELTYLLDDKEGTETQAQCTVCERSYPYFDGIWRMLTEEQQAAYARFMISYSGIREREGWVRDAPYYLALPNVAKDDPAASIWKIRRRSLAILEGLLPAKPGGHSWALDLGAGCGWLSARLQRKGYCVVALDLNTQGADSLQGAGVYFQEGLAFDRVQASIDSPPFANSAFDLCVSSAAFHYADSGEVLRAVYALLKPGGILAITDSPVYSDTEAGLAMVREQRKQLERLTGQAPEAAPNADGFLVEATLLNEMSRIGFVPTIYSTERIFGKVRRLLRRMKRQKREHARFPVVVGRKPGAVT